MEEKKSIKISLKTYLISMFIMLLIIGFLLGYILHTGENINKEIIENNQEQSLLNETINNENDVIKNEVEGELEDNTNKVTENENIEVKNEEAIFSENEISESLSKYLNAFYGHGSPEGMLVYMNLIEYSDTAKYELNKDNYKITDIKYSTFEEVIKEYTTLEHFKFLNEHAKFVSPEFKNIDGYLAYYDGGWSGVAYMVNDVTLKGDYSDMRYIAKYYTIEGEVPDDEMLLEFEIKDNNGKCIISNCYFE